MKARHEEFSLPEIQPLESLEEYENLTQEEIAVRQAAVTNYFVTFAVSYSRRVKKSTDYLLQEVDEYKEVGNYDYNSDAGKQKEIRLARKLVEADELCGTVLDRMVSFCMTSGTIENVRNKKLLKLLNRWKESLGNLESLSDQDTDVMVIKPHGLNVFLQMMLERLFVDGDSFISEIWANDVDLDGKTYKLPYKLNIHDTMLIEIDTETFMTTGQEKAFINLELASSELSFKKDNDTRIPLFSTNGKPFTTHLKLRPKTFMKWGTSYFKRAFHPVASKKRIEALEVNTIEGLINRLTILKAGKLDPESESGIVAPHRLAILERLISQPKVNNLLLWPGDDIEVTDIGPDKSLVTYEQKYTETNEQILASLGFPRVLVDGEGSSTENWQKFLGLISYIDQIRSAYIIPWVNQIMRKIAVKNGYRREYPRYNFSRVKLYDLKELLNAVKVYYDRGLMSELSAVTSGDLDYDIEDSRRAYEAEFGMVSKYGGPKSLPFSKNTEDGSSKEGTKSPEKTIDKQDKVAASIDDPDREDLVEVFEDYLFNLHDLYSDKVVEAVEGRRFDNVEPTMVAYYATMKQDVKEQMRALFRTEVTGIEVDDALLLAAMNWIEEFVDGFFDDMQAEVTSVIENNKTRPSVLPNLVAGVLLAFKTKRLKLYSSSIYNKAKSAGVLTKMKAEGKSHIQWKSALTDRTCEWCSAMHNKVLSLEDFFGHFPPHPSCECWGESTVHGASPELPRKDPKNWSRIIK